jgi:hypothetical protein
MNLFEKLIRKTARELTLKWRHPDRYILERKIFPKLVNKKILLVGVAQYTSDYPKRLGEGKDNEIWTIDIDPKVREFGAKNHIVDSISNADKHLEEEFFDIILMLGVFGYGLNHKKDGEKALKSCYNLLKKGGVVIITLTDLAPKNNLRPEKLNKFKMFKEASFQNYPKRYQTKDKKIFYFLSK